ncbi:uncharacterized protein [Ptychodera flava]|uniref:uncharacterized protein n=1 Tax=Ptychodera flava TaxID=63121 RepID=UPI00396A600F
MDSNDAEITYKVIDGGFSTELENRGFSLGGDPLWSARLLATNPDEVKEVHKSFLVDGADIIETGTYQASVWGFQKFHGTTESEAKELLKKGVQLAVEARDEFWEELKKSGKDTGRSFPLVAASLGPRAVFYADASEYTGDYVTKDSKQVLLDWHRQQVEVIAEVNPDILAIDTVPALAEAEAIVELLQDFPNQKAWICFSCKDDEHVSHGEKFADAIKVAATAPSVIGVGVNCTPPQYVEGLLKQIKGENGDKILIVFPNSGEIWHEDGHWHGNKNAKKLSEYVPAWIEAGAKWIGGCCRVTPQDISEVKKAMKEKVS